jgi:hypothetical protein
MAKPSLNPAVPERLVRQAIASPPALNAKPIMTSRVVVDKRFSPPKF